MRLSFTTVCAFRFRQFLGHSKTAVCCRRFSAMGEEDSPLSNGFDVYEPPSKRERRAKKKFAFLLSYDGRGYYGMQKNPGTPTIEEELLKALLKSEYIDEDSFRTPQNAWFQRAARTDKGVSAVRQVVSLRMDPEEGAGAVEKLNAILPAAIRVMGMRRVTRGFNPKTKCDARTYSYLLPTFALCHVEEDPLTETNRPPREAIEQFDSLLKRFIGTKKFHNFTARREMDCPSNSRYIMDFECGKPYEKHGMEWLLVTIKGQSFMLHQIRKMIGLCIAVVRGFASESVFEKVFQPDRVDVPMAPGLGLMLEKVHYQYYNERYGADGMHDNLDWADEEEKVLKFREDVIYNAIYETEMKEKSMLNWLATLPLHSYDVRESGPPNSQTAVRTGVGRALVSVELAVKAKKSEQDGNELPKIAVAE
ncbi:unnamed protein product [Notodromas monacha]|uniref:Pseudouridylate synthase 1 homolog n=1 Tax=Notodromas monacha TaxID=399045 RepID=A0A7R9GCV2_9CRUS|nr:unnamed protein product [Notodromas monacha]CAG0916334.1 unnamed protein product [Notodromas monacha]